jgi:ribonuclease BN (tRNA processing enzyme)
VTMACEVAAAARVGQLILFHHEPSYSDDIIAGMEQTAKGLFADTTSAYEGLEVVLPDEKMAGQLQSPATQGREVQYAQNG